MCVIKTHLAADFRFCNNTMTMAIKMKMSNPLLVLKKGKLISECQPQSSLQPKSNLKGTAITAKQIATIATITPNNAPNMPAAAPKSAAQIENQIGKVMINRMTKTNVEDDDVGRLITGVYAILTNIVLN